MGQGAVWVPLFGIVGAALFYGDALITPAISVLSAIEGLNEYNPALRPLRDAAHRADPGRAVRRADARHRAGGGVLRPGDVRVVRRHRAARHLLHRHQSGDPARVQSGLRGRVPAPARRDRARDARRRVSRRHRRRGALCRPRPFRQAADPVRLARPRAAVARAQLSRPGRRGAGRPQGDQEPVLSALSGLGAAADGAAGDRRDRHRQPGGHHRRLFAHPPGDPARPAAAHGDPPHLGEPRGADLHAAGQHHPADRRAPAGRHVPLVRRARLGLRHRGHRHHGGDRHDGVHRHLEGVAVDAARRRRADAPFIAGRRRRSCPPT